MGEGIWFTSIDKDYKTVNTDINYLGMLYKIMGEYFKKKRVNGSLEMLQYNNTKQS